METDGVKLLDTLADVNAREDMVFFVLAVRRDNAPDRPPNHFLGTVAKKIGGSLNSSS